MPIQNYADDKVDDKEECTNLEFQPLPLQVPISETFLDAVKMTICLMRHRTQVEQNLCIRLLGQLQQQFLVMKVTMNMTITPRNAADDLRTPHVRQAPRQTKALTGPSGTSAQQSGGYVLPAE